MDPATWGLIFTIISSATAAYVQHEDAEAQEDQAEINAHREREAAEAEAQQESLIRAAEAREEAAESQQRQSRLRAQIATSGVEFSGTATMLVDEQAGYDEYNIQQRDQDSRTRQRNLIVSGNRAYARGMGASKAYGRQARNSLITGSMNAGTSGMNYANNRGWLDKPVTKKAV